LARLGWNHVDLLTEDMAATRRFYEEILEMPVARYDLVDIDGVGIFQHVFFDCGNGQMLAFSSGEDAPGFPKGVETGINKGLGVSGAPYHFAFEAGSEEELLALQTRLEDHGITTRGPEDHEGWCRSVYFVDPNGLQLELCYLTRPIGTEEDLRADVRFRFVDGKKVSPLTN
jgi:catechol 2,3-dioxygenase-like lactoylglutathione lyase family enzyme